MVCASSSSIIKIESIGCAADERGVNFERDRMLESDDDDTDEVSTMGCSLIWKSSTSRCC